MITVALLQKEILPVLAPEDFFILLSHATGKEKTFLLAHPEYILDEKTHALAESFFARRRKHEPVAYIIGEKEFYGLSFQVNKETLIPRPETEILVENALALIPSLKSTDIDIVDVGTGSGAIILSLAHALSEKKLPSHIKLYGSDISERALHVAKENQKRQQTKLPVQLLQGNLLEPYTLLKEKSKTLLVLANLPYLSHALYSSTIPDVQNYEPKSALISENAGLAHSFELLSQLTALKDTEKIFCFFEISPEQTSSFVQHITETIPSLSYEVQTDLSGRDRFLFVSF